MPQQHNILEPNDPQRNVGLVYIDDKYKHSGKPAAHVLVIGVAAYQSEKFGKLLQTATISAREIADWFADCAKARFSNSHCELGSVAVLLSEKPGSARSVYLSGEVPRATFENVKTAMRAWVERINTHKDNLAILYVASHGESFLNRTAFLLENYGMDPFDATAGMVEVEQLVGALENAVAVPQLLLFDCCRSSTSAALPWNEVIGNKLVALTRRPDDHGEARKQWVICSTSLGKDAIGLATGPTLFNMALMESLQGVASDTSSQGWPVRPGLLLDKIDRILGLHRLPDEKAQTPAGRMAGSFDITYPGEFSNVPIYITLKDPADWPGATITLRVDGAQAKSINGQSGQSPFYIHHVPESVLLEIVATRDDANLGRATIRARPPAVFLTLEKYPEGDAILVGRLAPSRIAEPRAKLIIAIEGQQFVRNGAVVMITWRSKPGISALETTVHIGGETKMDLAPGDLIINLYTPDGRKQARDVALESDQIVRMRFSTQDSPHQWLCSAALAGVIRPALDTADLVAGQNIELQVVGSVGIDHQSVAPDCDTGIDLVPRHDDGRFARFDVVDLRQSRFVRNDVSSSAPMAFATIVCNKRRELAAIPTLGSGATGWRPYLLVDRSATASEVMTSAIVDDNNWAGLLGFLASREIVAGNVLLNNELYQTAIAAMHDKISNPLAATAGALIAVAASSPDFERTWELLNIANWFPFIPDGPIVLGRRLLMRARTIEQIAEAGSWFIAGFERGIPFYSLSVDWLARGLESLPGNEPALVAMQRSARQLVNRVDPTRAFTVIRLDEISAS
jgi:Caspase domain